MTDCVIVQPIAEAGLRLLREAGLSVHTASQPTPEAIRPHLAAARAVITRNAGFSAAMMAAAPHLSVVGSHGTGVDAIDLAAARARGITVVNTPGANAQAVAEMTFALILACAKSVAAADQAARQGDFAFRERGTTVELAGRRLGLVGFGHVARRVAHLAAAFDMDVWCHSRHTTQDELRAADIRPCASLDQLCREADVLSLHAIPDGPPLLDARRLALFKPGAILVNTARGALVDELALAEALRQGRPSAAGLDVFAAEPLPPKSPLLQTPNLVLTPHLGGSACEALDRTAVAVASQVLAVLRGERPSHPVVGPP